VHDTFVAACDRRRYELPGVKGYHRNCCDNMFEGMFALGLTPPRAMLASFTIVMNIQVQPDGITLKTLPTVPKAGDSITLRAEMDRFVAFFLPAGHRENPGRGRQHARTGRPGNPAQRARPALERALGSASPKAAHRPSAGFPPVRQELGGFPHSGGHASS